MISKSISGKQHTQDIQVIQFGSASIGFRVMHTGRKSLGITVSPDGSVFVKAPMSASLIKIANG